MNKVMVDRTTGFVSVASSGFFGRAELAAAAADLHPAIRSLGGRAGDHVTLYDLTEVQAASQGVVDGFARYFRDPAVAPLWARKVAMVTRSALVRRQIERVSAARSTIRTFDDRSAALAWLFDGRR